MNSKKTSFGHCIFIGHGMWFLFDFGVLVLNTSYTDNSYNIHDTAFGLQRNTIVISWIPIGKMGSINQCKNPD